MKNIVSIILVLIAVNLQAQSELTLESQIKDVIVYRQGARITRTVNVNLTKGKSTLILNEITAKLDKGSLQVKGAENLIIVSVSHETSFLNKKKVSDQIAQMEQRQTEIQDSVAILNGLKKVYFEEKEMILSNKTIGGNNGLNIEELQKAAEFFRFRLMEIESKSKKLGKHALLLKQEKLDITNQLRELNANSDQPTSQVKVIVSAKKNGNYTIELEYVTNDAGWIPKYDIRLSEISKPLALTYKAKVSQNTNEDWKNVNLTLSTGNPSVSNYKPALETYFLTFNNYYKESIPIILRGTSSITGKVSGVVTDASTGEALPGASVVIKGTTTGTITDLDGNYELDILPGNQTLEISFIGYVPEYVNADRSVIYTSLEPDVMALDEVVVIGYGTSGSSAVYGSHASSGYGYSRPVKKDHIPLAIQKRQTSTEFEIDIPYDIPSDNKQYDVSMVEYKLDASYYYSAVPKLSDEIFLTAKLSDWTDYNLLNGEASIFFKGIYQGNTYLNLDSFEDTLSVSIGRDEDIVISRDIQKDFSSEKSMGSHKKVLKSWEITVKNNKLVPVDLVIEDQYPVSKEDNIKVDRIDDSGAEVNKENGKMKWYLDLDGGEKKSFLVKYEVKYPKYKKVIVD